MYFTAAPIKGASIPLQVRQPFLEKKSLQTKDCGSGKQGLARLGCDVVDCFGIFLQEGTPGKRMLFVNATKHSSIWFVRCSVI